MSDQSETQEIKIELRNLDSLLSPNEILCKKFGENFKMVNFTSKSLIPPGEYYSSSMFEVSATIKREFKGKTGEEVLELVAKMQPPTEYQRSIIDTEATFEKEVYWYEKLIPSYQKLERDLGVDEVFDIIPKYYGARYFLDSNKKFDFDAVILMENLKTLDYYTQDRRKGLDLEHAKIAITALARFHALGVAMKKHKPEEFEKIKERANCAMRNGLTTLFEEVNTQMQKLVSEDPEMSAYSEATEPAILNEDAMEMKNFRVEPWNTIVHSDFWVNNLMFHKDAETSRVDGVKFVDFQNYQFLSPFSELIFFLIDSTNAEVMKNNFDELVDIYYETFIQVLKKMQCDTTAFSREDFNKKLNAHAFYTFPHCCYRLQMICADVKPGEVFDSAEKFKNMAAGNRELLINWLRRCVKKYSEKRWLEIPEKRLDSVLRCMLSTVENKRF